MTDRQTSVKLFLLSRAPHNRLIVTGFHELERQGVLNLSIIKDYERGAKLPPWVPLTEAIINGKIKIAFDTSDGYASVKQVDDYLDDIDFYFKRSFSKENNKRVFPKNYDKVFPLSFNYDVSYFFNPMDFSHTLTDISVIARKVIKPYNMQAYENTSTSINHRILFMCRLWDPEGSDVNQYKPAQDERIRINQMRIDVIRALREKYGTDFIGGVSDDDYSRKVCPDLILCKELTSKKHYLSVMKKCEVCIATTGLHKSTGWKFAEYVVAGKAIVSEPLCYEVYGDFLAGKNYLEFSSVEECLRNVETLLRNEKMRKSLEMANREYYSRYCRPDKQIQNALQLALTRANS